MFFFFVFNKHHTGVPERCGAAGRTVAPVEAKSPTQRFKTPMTWAMAGHGAMAGSAVSW